MLLFFLSSPLLELFLLLPLRSLSGGGSRWYALALRQIAWLGGLGGMRIWDEPRPNAASIRDATVAVSRHLIRSIIRLFLSELSNLRLEIQF